MSLNMAQLEVDLITGVNLLPDKFEPIYDKMKAKCEPGKRIWWYYMDDVAYAKQEGFDVKQNAGYSGILVPRDGIEERSEYDYEDVVVISDRYPTEKCNPDVQWITLIRLLISPGLVEVFSEEDKYDKSAGKENSAK